MTGRITRWLLEIQRRKDLKWSIRCLLSPRWTDAEFKALIRDVLDNGKLQSFVNYVKSGYEPEAIIHCWKNEIRIPVPGTGSTYDVIEAFNRFILREIEEVSE